MRKQRKLLTKAEKDKICKDRDHKCNIWNATTGEDKCPLFVKIEECCLCYNNIKDLEDNLRKIGNEEVQINVEG